MNNPETPETPKTFAQQALELKYLVTSNLTYFNESQLKQLIDQEAPHPQMFENITKSTFIDEMLEKIIQMSASTSNSNEAVICTSAHTAASKAKCLFDACFRHVTILKLSKTRKSVQYLESLDRVRQLFVDVEKELYCLASLLHD